MQGVVIFIVCSLLFGTELTLPIVYKNIICYITLQSAFKKKDIMYCSVQTCHIIQA